MNIDYIRLVREWYDKGVRGGNFDILLSRLSDQIEWWCFGPPGFQTNGYYEGREGVKRFFINLSQTLEVDMAKDFVPVEFHLAGTVVFVFGRETGVVKQSNVPQNGQNFHNYFAHTFYFDGDKISRFRVNYTIVPPDSVAPPV